MATQITAGIEEHFKDLKDPRIDRQLHKLIDILVIAICAVICGADTWEDVAAFGEAKQAWAQLMDLTVSDLPPRVWPGRSRAGARVDVGAWGGSWP